MLSSASSRTARAEIKFNVQTEFPHLGLHAAAASGDYGHVKYALEHGQPVNSVLDGVLPLHAASAGGNEMVVKLLIESGADVNAARLPRKYSASASSSHPVIGSSGATPLHFAAANGNIGVLRLLLQHGAHADHKDKHGVTPAVVARENGHEQCAALLMEWESGERDRDLIERDNQHQVFGKYTLEQTAVSDESGSARDPVRLRTDSLASSGRNHSMERSKLRVKRSIDTALHSLVTLKSFPSSTLLQASTPVATTVDLSTTSSDHKPRSRSHHRSSPRRPKSAGGSHEPSPSASRKLGSKYSLLNMFKRNTSDELGHDGTTTSSPAASPRNMNVSLPATSSSTLRHNSEIVSQDFVADVSRVNDGDAASPLPRPSILRPRVNHGTSSSTSTSAGIGTPSATSRILRFEDTEAEALPSPIKGDLTKSREVDVADSDDEEEYGTILSTGTDNVRGLRQPLSATSPMFELRALPPVSTPPEVPITIEVAAEDADVSPSLHAADRTRGNSVSSIDPDAPPLSWGSTNTSDASGVNTPPKSSVALATTSPVKISVKSASPEGLLLAPVRTKRSRSRLRTSSSSSGVRPLDIDIRGISSHAQAERRVLEAQQSLLDRSANWSHDTSTAQFATTRGSDSSNVAWSPLSSKLAAYGESLRQLKRVEEAGSAIEEDNESVLLAREAEKRAAVLREIEKKRRPSSPSTPPTAYFAREKSNFANANATMPSNRKRRGSGETSRSNEARPNTSSGLASTSMASQLETPRRHQSSHSITSIHARARAQSLRPELDTTDTGVAKSKSATPPLLTPSSAPVECALLSGVSVPATTLSDAESPTQMLFVQEKVPPAIRQINSASKLTRMGFSGSPVVSSSALVGGSPSSRNSNKSRFGLGNIIHTLKGKS